MSDVKGATYRVKVVEHTCRTGGPTGSSERLVGKIGGSTVITWDDNPAFRFCPYCGKRLAGAV